MEGPFTWHDLVPGHGDEAGEYDIGDFSDFAFSHQPGTPSAPAPTRRNETQMRTDYVKEPRRSRAWLTFDDRSAWWQGHLPGRATTEGQHKLAEGAQGHGRIGDRSLREASAPPTRGSWRSK
jgi:hypothetical protein